MNAVHVNYSMTHLGSRKYRHEKIGYGNIGTEAFERIKKNPRVQGLPFILETPNDDAGYAKEIAFLKR